MASKEDNKRAALNFANKVRKLMSLPPVDHVYPGRIGDGYACAITNTVYDDDVDRDKFLVWTNGASCVVRRVDLPTTDVSLAIPPFGRVAKFIETFDNEKYPELIDRG